jgi:hypothetical protein
VTGTDILRQRKSGRYRDIHLKETLQSVGTQTNSPGAKAIGVASVMLPSLHALPQSLLPPQSPCMQGAALRCAVCLPCLKNVLQQHSAPVMMHFICHPTEHITVPVLQHTVTLDTPFCGKHCLFTKYIWHVGLGLSWEVFGVPAPDPGTNQGKVRRVRCVALQLR